MVFSLYLAIIKIFFLIKLIKKNFKKILLILINVDKGQGGGSSNVDEKIAYCEYY